MKRGIQCALLAALLALALPVIASAEVNHGTGEPPNPLGIDVNVDLTNLGPAAYDVAFVLQGSQTLTNHYDGYHSGDKVGWFNSPTTTTVSGNTVIHWQTFWDGHDNRIDTNQLIHVGFSSAGQTILDIYWTGPDGQRLPGSKIHDVKVKLTTQGGQLFWTFANNFVEEAQISVSNIRYAVFPQPFQLGDLNSENIELASALNPLAADLVLGPGEQQSLPVPGFVPPGSAVVAVYETSAPGTNAIVVNYVQTLAQ